MYTSFYNLNKKPFQISSDPDFMWLGEKHKEALATLKYGILDNKGFLLMTGDVGTGKTTLINSLVQGLNDDIICTSVPDPSLSKLDFFNYITNAFGIEKEILSKGSFLVHFRKFLMNANENNKKVLLIIDEAQLLTQEMLEEIRLLSNIEKVDAKLINIFFIGQNEFNEILSRQQNRAVRQRMTLNYNIDPLTPDETGEYIRHRLSVAGAVQPIFNESATQEVFMYSGGFPRRINVICDHCLLSGYVKEQKIINSAIVKECAKELKIPAHVQNRDINGFDKRPEKKAPIVQPKPFQVQPAPIEPKKEKSFFQILLTGIICFVFVVFAWFYLFPESAKKSMVVISENVLELKSKYLDTQKKKPTSRLNQNPESEKPIKEKSIPATTNEELINNDQTNNDQANNDQANNEKILSGNKKVGSEDEIKHKIIVEKKNGSSAADLENETEKQQVTGLQNNSPTNISKDIKFNIKKINFPLPKDKIIVRFKYNSNDFTKEGYTRLVNFADILNTHPGAKVMLSGYTDSQGNKEYNIKLSEFRANIVGSFFLGRGIKQDQIKIKGMGSQNPIESNNTSWGRMMNRRVEIKIIK